MITFAQISDPHVRVGDERRTSRLRAVAAHLDTLDGLAAVLVTGDVTQDGLPEELTLFHELAPQRHRVIVLPGNHDGRGPAHRDPVFAQAVHDLGGARLVTLDTVIPGYDDGALGPAALTALDALLREEPRPTVLALHHPPATLHMVADSWPLQDAADLADVIGAHPHVVAVLAGHAHTIGFTSVAGRPLFCCPALASAAKLPPEGDGVVRDDPPMFALHTLADGRLTTHVRTVPSP